MLKYPYWYFESALTKEQCDMIRSVGMRNMNDEINNGKSVVATTFGDSDVGSRPNKISRGDKTFSELHQEGITADDTYDRDSKVSWISDKEIFELVHPYVHEANKNAGWNWEWDFSENAQFTKYDENGFYSWHQDCNTIDHNQVYRRYIHGVTPEPLRKDGSLPSGYTRNDNMVGKIRKISVTINLCEDHEYEGGNLMFDFGEHRLDGERFHECTEIRTQGSIIVFPSFLNHCVTPVKRGTRYSLVMWNLGRPFK